MDAVGHRLDQRPKEVAGDTGGGLLVQLDEGELRRPVDRHEELQLAFRRPRMIVAATKSDRAILSRNSMARELQTGSTIFAEGQY